MLKYDYKPYVIYIHSLQSLQKSTVVMIQQLYAPDVVGVDLFLGLDSDGLAVGPQDRDAHSSAGHL